MNNKVIGLKIIIFFSIFTVLFYTCIPKKNTAREYKELAEGYRLKAKMKKSARTLEKAAKLDPNDPDIYILLAEAICDGWNPGPKVNSRITAAYNNAFMIQPWSARALLSRAKFHEFNSEYRLAEQNLDSLLRRDPGNVEAYLLKADIHFNRTDTTGFNILRAAYDKVQYKDRSRIVHAQAIKEFQLTMYIRSINSFKKDIALSEKKKIVSSYCYLARAYAAIEKKDSACRYYTFCEDKWFYRNFDTKELNTLCGK